MIPFTMAITKESIKVHFLLHRHCQSRICFEDQPELFLRMRKDVMGILKSEGGLLYLVITLRSITSNKY